MNNYYHLLIKYLLTTIVFTLCSGSKILGILTTPSKSHLSFATTILKGLAARGHEVCNNI